MDYVLKSKLFLLICAILALLGTLASLYRVLNYSNFSINSNGDNLYIDLANNRYIGFDYTLDKMHHALTGKTVNPFPADSRNTMLVTGLDFGPFNKTYIQTTTSDTGKRILSVTRTSPNSVLLDFAINTNYQASDYRDYTFQVDYSGITKIITNDTLANFADSGCSLKVNDNLTATYDDLDNGKTILVSIPYSQVMLFRINMQITCKQ